MLRLAKIRPHIEAKIRVPLFQVAEMLEPGYQTGYVITRGRKYDFIIAAHRPQVFPGVGDGNPALTGLHDGNYGKYTGTQRIQYGIHQASLLIFDCVQYMP